MQPEIHIRCINSCNNQYSVNFNRTVLQAQEFFLHSVKSFMKYVFGTVRIFFIMVSLVLQIADNQPIVLHNSG